MKEPADDPLREILDTYLRVPETPARASETDLALATKALLRGVDPHHLTHAIRLATLRRHLRDPAEPPLPPVRSLAYYLRTLDGLEHAAFDPGYMRYVDYRFRLLLSPPANSTPQEPRSPNQNPALLHDR